MKGPDTPITQATKIFRIQERNPRTIIDCRDKYRYDDIFRLSIIDYKFYRENDNV